MNIWEFHDPGEHYHTGNVNTLYHYALSPEALGVRFICESNNRVAEFRVDGPEAKLVWHELTGYLTQNEQTRLRRMCNELGARHMLSIM